MATEASVKPVQASVLGAAMTALEFYTRLPRPAWSPWCAQDARSACAFAPLAGGLIAGLGSAIWCLSSLALPEPLAAIAAVAAMVAMTGALHEDGLADVCDAFGAAADAPRTLEILKDPRLGVYGVLGLLLSMAVRIASLWQIAQLSHGAWAIMSASLLAAHALSRFAAIFLTRSLDYARSNDASARVAAFASPLQGRALLVATVSTVGALIPLCLLGLAPALWVLPLMFAVGVWLRGLFRRRIGGYTGDCLGCVQQVTELLLYLAVVAALFGPGTM